MKISVNREVSTPQAFIAVNKSRIKQYNKLNETPTYYLQKGQEFQLELFNPTTGTILAKIFLNGNAISQGGLVLKPGQRIFLDRYIDVAKKFLFDTYEVSNTNEVKKAIEDNGDFKVEFYKEFVLQVKPNYFSGNIGTTTITYVNNNLTDGTYNLPVNNNTLGFYDTQSLYSNTKLNANINLNSFKGPNIRSKKSLTRSIETGRVEQGSQSSQKLTTVNMNWEIYPFHTLEYKMLPLSQKINTSEDINIKRYCTNCGAKLSKGHKFCSSCGTKA
jgi:hypothetical protein